MNFRDWIIRKVIPWYTSLGFTRRTITLEKRGRHSGILIRVSLSRTDCNGRSYFVSLAGESQWVQNVRAAEGKVTILSGKRRSIKLIEIPRKERAEVLLAYVQTRAFTHSGAQSARHFFGLDHPPTLADMEALADRYPVFEIVSA